MAITAPLAELVVREHVRAPLAEPLLTIGRQTIFLKPEELILLLRKYSLPIPVEDSIETTRMPGGELFVTDSAFFHCLGIGRVDAIDISAYEGANLIHDMADEALSTDLQGRYQFILNGSCLDNICDPMAALRNMSRLLATGGRILHMEHGTNFNGPYLTFSPGWLVDYYVYNRFAACRAYAGLFADSETLYYGPWRLFKCPATTMLTSWAHLPQPGVIRVGDSPAIPHLMTVVFAEKAAGSTVAARPVQRQYRTDEQQQWYVSQVRRIPEVADLDLLPVPYKGDPSWLDCDWFGNPDSWANAK